MLSVTACSSLVKQTPYLGWSRWPNCVPVRLCDQSHCCLPSDLSWYATALRLYPACNQKCRKCVGAAMQGSQRQPCQSFPTAKKGHMYQNCLPSCKAGSQAGSHKASLQKCLSRPGQTRLPSLPQLVNLTTGQQNQPSNSTKNLAGWHQLCTPLCSSLFPDIHFHTTLTCHQ